MTRNYSFAIALGAHAPDEGLMAVRRFTDRADPMYCKCGITWGMHGCRNTAPQEEFCYDLDNQQNAIKRDFSGYTDEPS